MARRPNLICPACKSQSLTVGSEDTNRPIGKILEYDESKKFITTWRCNDCAETVVTEYSLTAILDHY